MRDIGRKKEAGGSGGLGGGLLMLCPPDQSWFWLSLNLLMKVWMEFFISWRVDYKTKIHIWPKPAERGTEWPQNTLLLSLKLLWDALVSMETNCVFAQKWCAALSLRDTVWRKTWCSSGLRLLTTNSSEFSREDVFLSWFRCGFKAKPPHSVYHSNLTWQKSFFTDWFTAVPNTINKTASKCKSLTKYLY